MPPSSSVPQPPSDVLLPASRDPGSYRELRPLQKFAPVNLVLIVASVLVTLPLLLDVHEEWLLPLFISLYPAASPERLLEISHGEIWRLFTPAFLHFNIAHIAFNMIGLKNVGDLMERVHGSRFYLLLAAVLALCSNLGQYFIYGSPYFGGMSGVLYGLFGFLWLRSLCDPSYPLRLTQQTIVISLVWFAACFTGKLGPIANGAHSIGLVLGAVWGLVAARLAVRRAAGFNDQSN